METIIVACVSENGVIGKDGKLPWRISEDLKRFREMTMGYSILMGRKTYESIPDSFRPLEGRRNLVLSRSGYSTEGVEVVNSFGEAVGLVEMAGGKRLYVAGGESVFENGLEIADVIELTRVHGSIGGDKFFPEIREEIWNKVWSKDGREFNFERYMRRKR